MTLPPPQSHPPLPARPSTRRNVGRSERVGSFAGGSLLTWWALRSRADLPARLGLAALGAGLLQRAVSGYSPVNRLLDRDTAHARPNAMEIRTAKTVFRPREEIYTAWRHFERFPEVMHHLERVTVEGTSSHWVARVPGGLGTVRWDAEIVEEEFGKLLSWCSLPGSTIDNCGTVRFEEAPGGRGTEVHVSIVYRLPAGDVGRLAQRLFGGSFRRLVHEDVRRLQQAIELGRMASRPTETLEAKS